MPAPHLHGAMFPTRQAEQWRQGWREKAVGQKPADQGNPQAGAAPPDAASCPSLGGLMSCTARAGAIVSAFMAEMMVEAAMVRANWR